MGRGRAEEARQSRRPRGKNSQTAAGRDRAAQTCASRFNGAAQRGRKLHFKVGTEEWEPVVGIRGQIGLELDEKPGCPGSSHPKPCPRPVPIPTRTQLGLLRPNSAAGGLASQPARPQAESASCAEGKPAAGKANSATGPDTVSAATTLPPQDTCTSTPAHQTTGKPVPRTSRLVSSPRLAELRTQADPKSRSGPVTLDRQDALDQRCVSAPRTDRGASQGKTSTHREATDAITFKEVSQYLHSGSGIPTQADQRPSTPLISSIS